MMNRVYRDFIEHRESNNYIKEIRVYDIDGNKKVWDEYNRRLRKAIRDSSYEEGDLFPVDEWS